VEAQVVAPLVDALAPRVAELVLSRVAATLVEQVAGSVTASVQQGLAERVRAATVESERRISAHVDEAVLVLAEALLRRRRVLRSGAAALGAGLEDVGAAEAGQVADVSAQVPEEVPGSGRQRVVTFPAAVPAGSLAEGLRQPDAADEAALDESGAGAGLDLVPDGAAPVDAAPVDAAPVDAAPVDALVDESGAMAGADLAPGDGDQAAERRTSEAQSGDPAVEGSAVGERAVKDSAAGIDPAVQGSTWRPGS
jgi:hypothetical protein